jgi:hypothetical protein
MLVFTPLDPKIYLQAATNMTYWRLFPLILQDFITRADMQELMLPTNLLVTGSAGPAPITGGMVQAIQKGSSPGAGSQTLKASVEAKKQFGGAAINESLGALGKV